MARRILTAAVGIPLLIVILLGPVILTDILIVAAALLAAYEFLRLTDHTEFPIQMGFVLLLLALVAVPIILTNNQILLLDIGLILLVVVIYFSRILPPWFAEGVLYLGIPLATVIALRMMDAGQEWIVIVLAGTWATDTMALFGGKAFGRTKLTTISPNKTREGTAIGIVAGTAAILAAGALLGLLDDYPLTVILAAVLLPPLAVIGDLIESKIKRNYGKKDSGSLLPGHGGILDRIDSLLLTAPTVWLLVVLTAS